ncbi:unnamed protein product [Blepharisma stoltei]|uniref:GTP-binding protein n=1 Tax=Blepharisma stoltei TaxID=1481888 RepID=A0AAU9JTI1_9CILI|nr:unnamed protein product [Blepharisma stoltei]
MEADIARSIGEHIGIVIIIGDAQVGKTNLMTRLTDNYFNLNYFPTSGADFMYKEVEINNINLSLQVWDTGGQDRFASIFYSGADFFLFVYDITNRNSFENVHGWYELIKINEIPKKFEMMLIGNKIDLNKIREVTYEEGMLLAKKLGMYFLEVSNLSKNNIDDVLLLLANNISIKYSNSI